MYIPKEFIMFILGFICFPIFAYIIFEIGKIKGWQGFVEEQEKEGEKKNEKLEKKK